MSTKVRKLFESAIASEDSFIELPLLALDRKLALELRRVTNAQVGNELTIALDILLSEVVE